MGVVSQTIPAGWDTPGEFAAHGWHQGANGTVAALAPAICGSVAGTLKRSPGSDSDCAGQAPIVVVAEQQARRAVSGDGWFVVGDAAVPDAKPVGYDRTRLGGIDHRFCANSEGRISRAVAVRRLARLTSPSRVLPGSLIFGGRDG